MNEKQEIEMSDIIQELENKIRVLEESLGESENRYHALFNTIVHGIVYQDADGKIIRANAAAERLLGLTREQMLGVASVDPRWKSIHPDGSDFPGETHPAMISLQTGEKVLNVVMGIYNPKLNDYRWLNINSIPQFRAGETKPYQVYAIFEDISERKIIEEKLRKNETYLRKAEKVARIGNWTFKLNEKIMRASEGAMTIYGVTTGELPLAAAQKFPLPEFRNKMDIALTNLIEHNIAYEIEYKISRQSDGKIIDIHSVAEYDPVEQTVFGVIQDITERKQTMESLSTSEEQYRKLVTTIPDVIVRTDLNGTVTFVNETNIHLMGYEDVNGVIGKQMLSFIAPEDIAKAVQLSKRMFEGRLGPQEYKLIGVDGKKIDCEVNGDVLYDSDGLPYGMVYAIRNITERKQAEEDLRKSEEKYRTIFENTGTAGILVEENTIISLANSEFEHLSGYLKQEIEGKISWTVFPVPEDLEWMRKQHKLRRENGEAALNQYEFRFVKRSGEIRNIHLTIDIFPGTKRSIASLLDITERKLAEQAVRDSENLYRKMNDNSPMGMHFYELRKDKLFFTGYNPVADKLLGVDHSKFIGKTIEEAFPSLAQTEVPERYRNAALKGVLWTTEQIVYQDERISGAFEVKVFQTIPGKMVAIFADITSRKIADEKIFKMNSELERRVHKRTAQLEAANKELESFAYSISHDLRAPLRAIDGFGMALLEDYSELLDEQAKGYIERIRSNSQRMSTLIDDLLNISKLFKKEISGEQIDLSALVSQTFNELTEFIKDRKIELKVTPGIVDRVDPKLIKLCLHNLLDNAIKFSGNNPKAVIEFGMEKKESRKIYFIRDNGVGFNMKYSHKLFGVFQRLHREDEFPGTGIGLAIVQKIIRKHNGNIWALSEPDKGAIFYFTLNELIQ